MTLRAFVPAALVALSISAPGLSAGLDEATASRVRADAAAIRKADASRRATLLTRGTDPGDRQRALYEFRDQRRKAALDAAEALLAVRGAVPKEEWKAILGELGASGGIPSLVESAKTELPNAVADPARRAAAATVLEDLGKAIKKSGTDPASARQKFLALLDKKSSTKQDFISAYEKVNDAQEKLDDRVLDGISNLQRTLQPEEWDDLVRRISPQAK